MKKLCFDPTFKSTHGGYRDQAIGFMSIQHKSSQLCYVNHFRDLIYFNYAAILDLYRYILLASSMI